MKTLISQFLIFLTLLSCSDEYNDIADSFRVPQSEEVSVEILLDRSDVIWGFEFLPDGQIIFTEREGRILIFNPENKETTPVTGVPAVAAGGEGGLLDLRLHPDFRNNNQIYFCYSEASGTGRTQSLGRARLQGTTLVNFERIFSAGAPNDAPNHFGCRIEFTTNNQLFLSLGEQGEADRAQDPTLFQGKILRMNDDGSSLELFSLGHRNPQGLTIHPTTGELYSSEHGPTGDDELNLIEQGNNYGWPVVTPGSTAPIISWSPAIAPSGIIFYTGNQISGWQGDLFIATLRGQHIRRLTLNGTQISEEEMLFVGSGMRFRTIRNGPDGFLYFSTDGGKIGKITPLQ